MNESDESAELAIGATRDRIKKPCVEGLSLLLW